MTTLGNQSRVVRLLLLAWLLVSGAAAEEPDYQVEVIVFAQAADSQEQGSLTTVWPDLRGAIELPPRGSREGFVRLPEAKAGLASVKAVLERSPRYQVIKHLVWQQPGLSKRATKPVRVHGGIDYAAAYPERMQAAYGPNGTGGVVPITPPRRLDELDGTLAVALGRYLHVYADLVYRRPTMMERTLGEDETLRSKELVDFTLRGHRRVRSGELHYLDHPRFGVLVKITAVERSAR